VSNNGPSLNGKKDRPGYGSMFPQWALELIRKQVAFYSRLIWKIEFTGLENVPAHGGLIVAANHQTYIDPFWLSVPIKRPTRYLAWSDAFKWPIVGRALILFGAWPLAIEGSDPKAIRSSIQWLREDGVIVIFPEGGRSTSSGELDRFKAGAVRLAMEANVPILPVTIRGGNKVWPRGWRFPRAGKVVITYHPLHRAEPCSKEETRASARRESEKLAQVIASAL
jgi:1-acyl-sn-glycerol-3-phosphate acyltransferase